MQSIFGASLQIFLDFTQYSAVQYSPSRRSYNHAIELTIMYQIDLANQASFVEITEKGAPGLLGTSLKNKWKLNSFQQK